MFSRAVWDEARFRTQTAFRTDWLPMKTWSRAAPADCQGLTLSSMTGWCYDLCHP